ncbi:MAG: UvrB/UvrC motif-containing protein [Acetivibrionales bacterium]|jgi:protein arginine kinase activator
MLCQQCHQREANVHFTQVINGKKVEMYLCGQCAAGKEKITFSPQLNLVSFLWGFPGFGANTGFPKAGPKEIRCEVCNMSFDDFRKTGKLGCANCYRIFRNNLKPILRRLHGNTEHTGKVPLDVSDDSQEKTPVKHISPRQEGTDRDEKIKKLKEELEAAISSERYERAAELRDMIRDLENARKKQGGV